jgi:hypothetical protein
MRHAALRCACGKLDIVASGKHSTARWCRADVRWALLGNFGSCCQGETLLPGRSECAS